MDCWLALRFKTNFEISFKNLISMFYFSTKAAKILKIELIHLEPAGWLVKINSFNSLKEMPLNIM